MDNILQKFFLSFSDLTNSFDNESVKYAIIHTTMLKKFTLTLQLVYIKLTKSLTSQKLFLSVLQNSIICSKLRNFLLWQSLIRFKLSHVQ